MSDNRKAYDEKFGDNENKWETTSTSAPNFSESQLDFKVTFPVISEEF